MDRPVAPEIMAEGWGEGKVARLFFSILQLCPETARPKLFQFKVSFRADFRAATTPPHGGCLYCARQRCPRCGHSTSAGGEGEGGVPCPTAPFSARQNFSFRKHTSYRRFSFEALFAGRRYCQQVNPPLLPPPPLISSKLPFPPNRLLINFRETWQRGSDTERRLSRVGHRNALLFESFFVCLFGRIAFQVLLFSSRHGKGWEDVRFLRFFRIQDEINRFLDSIKILKKFRRTERNHEGVSN